MLSISWLCACWLLCACSSADEGLERGGTDSSTVRLTIQAMVPGTATRADATTIPEREQIEGLRIIVVDKESGKVEYNRLCSAPDREKGSSYDIEVTKNGTKVIYLLANAESYISSNVQELNDKAIETLPQKLPFTSRYEIEVGEEDVTATCYIAIAAVKFLVKITNQTGNSIEISSLQIAGTANKSYLFPHLEEGQWDQWINSVIAQDGNYITAYNIPDDATHSPFTLSDEPISINSDETSVIGPAYSHESKLLFASLDPDGDSTEQHYTIQFQIGGTNYHAEIEGLKSLIRSTYVIINININQLEIATDNKIVIWGTIKPWVEEEIEGGLEEVEAPQISLLTY